MNSSLEPFGPRRRNSEITSCPAVATLAGGSTTGETLMPVMFLALTVPRVRGAGATVGASLVVLPATGVSEAGSETVGCAYAPNTITAGASSLLFFFFLDF